MKQKFYVKNSPSHIKITKHFGSILYEAKGKEARHIFERTKGNSKLLVKSILIERDERSNYDNPIQVPSIVTPSNASKMLNDFIIALYKEYEKGLDAVYINSDTSDGTNNEKLKISFVNNPFNIKDIDLTDPNNIDLSIKERPLILTESSFDMIISPSYDESRELGRIRFAYKGAIEITSKRMDYYAKKMNFFGKFDIRLLGEMYSEIIPMRKNVDNPIYIMMEYGSISNATESLIFSKHGQDLTGDSRKLEAQTSELLDKRENEKILKKITKAMKATE